MKLLQFIFTIATVSAAFSTSPYLPIHTKGKLTHTTVPTTNLNLAVFTPPLATKTPFNGFPVILCFTGFGGNIGSRLYTDLFTSLASKGSGAVVVSFDAFPTSPIDQEALSEKLWYVISHLYDRSSNGFEARLVSHPFRNFKGLELSREKLFYLGHSSGAQLVVLGMKIRQPTGFIFLDPVDSDPVGI
jgi:hypothetical protein